MDVDYADDSDSQIQDQDASLVSIQNHGLPDGLFVTVVDHGREMQSQWSVTDFLKQIFSTQDEDRLREHFANKTGEIEDIHRKLWPGFEIPDNLVSKHGTEKHEASVYLKKKTMPTSICFCWLAWALEKERRMPAERTKTKAFARRFLKHVLQVAGSLQFNITTVGARGFQAALGSVVQVSETNSCVDSKLLWNMNLKGRIAPTWEARRNDLSEDLSSVWNRPEWIDFIIFALDPRNKSVHTLLASVAWEFLAQTASWVDNNVSRLAVLTGDLLRERQKNKSENLAVKTAVAIEAAEFWLHRNDP